MGTDAGPVWGPLLDGDELVLFIFTEKEVKWDEGGTFDAGGDLRCKTGVDVTEVGKLEAAGGLGEMEIGFGASSVGGILLRFFDGDIWERVMVGRLDGLAGAIGTVPLAASSLGIDMFLK